MEKILVSACFLGQRVRYDAQANYLLDNHFNRWQTEGRIVSICPEVSGGLSIPRDPAEIIPLSNSIITIKKHDVTAEFTRGAQHALNLCLKENIHYALLKEYSPSCGSEAIYDGTFSNETVAGQGVTSKLLREHGIKVFSEQNIAELALCLMDNE